MLSFLHLLNDGFLSALPLPPFASEDSGLPMTMIGALGSLLSFSGIVLAIPAGMLSSRFGAKRILSLLPIGYALGFILLGISQSVLMVFISFAIASIAFGVFHPIAFSAVAGQSDDSSIGRAMGMFAATGDIGKIALAALVTVAYRADIMENHIYFIWRTGSDCISGILRSYAQ